MTERRMLPILSEDNLCSSCTGACCRKGTTIPLTESEGRFLEENGASLFLTDLDQKELGEFEPKSYYYLLDDCPFLVQTVGSVAVCSIYTDERKPTICNDFEAGGESCLQMRRPSNSAPQRPPSQIDFMM